MTTTSDATMAAAASPTSTATERREGAVRGSADSAKASACLGHSRARALMYALAFTVLLSPGAAIRPSTLRGSWLRTKDDRRPVSDQRRSQVAHRGRRPPRLPEPSVPAWTHSYGSTM